MSKEYLENLLVMLITALVLTFVMFWAYILGKCFFIVLGLLPL